MNSKKLSLVVLATGITVAPILSAVACGASASLSFWNYEQYINPDINEKIKNEYGSKVFGDTDELSASIIDKKVLSAISSDFQVDKLVREGKLQKINFKKLWNIDYATTSELELKLKDIYSPFVWNAYKTLSTAEVNFFEYGVPYFAQEKVIAFDITKGNWDNTQQSTLNTVAGLDSIFTDKSYNGILTTLKDNGHQKLLINDYYRDNLSIGSEYGDSTFTTTPTSDNFQSQINGFVSTIKNGFGQDPTNENVKFNTDGTSVLNELIDPSLSWDSAIMYNGDTLDAYYHDDNFKDSAANIRSVKPDNPIYLIDMYIIPEYIKDSNLEKAYSLMKDYIFGDPDVIADDFAWEDSQLANMPYANNFDYVNYTVAFKKLNEWITNPTNGYFFDDTFDEIANDIYQLSTDQPHKSNFLSNISGSLISEINVKYNNIK